MLARFKDLVGFNPMIWTRAVPRMRLRVREFVAASADRRSPESRSMRCLVIIAPWLGTSIPWFSLAVGLMLAAEGASVTFVVDNRRFGPNPLRFRFVLSAIKLVMSAVERHHPVVTLSDVSPVAIDESALAEIEKLARLNTTWALRGEIVERGRGEFEASSRAQIAAAYGNIAGMFRDCHWDVMFLPGGVYGTSGVWRRCAAAAGVRVATFDTGGYETVMLASDGLACQLHDVPRAFHALRDRFTEHAEERSLAVAAAEHEIAKRRQGSDAFESQIKGASSGSDDLNGGILIALNSSWDAAALGPHKVFSGNTEWIVETVRFLLECTEVPVIVRQHPAERLEFAKTTDDYRALLDQAFGENPRLHFIAAEDPINSYALLMRAAAVVVHTSTIGIEAAASGCPVITGSTGYYSDLGFVHRARNRAEYEDLLLRAAAGKLEVDDARRLDAKLCMYVTQCRNWVFSVFNPADYRRWSARPLAAWHREPAVQRMLQSILTNTPVAVLNHIAAREM